MKIVSNEVRLSAIQRRAEKIAADTGRPLAVVMQDLIKAHIKNDVRIDPNKRAAFADNTDLNFAEIATNKTKGAYQPAT